VRSLVKKVSVRNRQIIGQVRIGSDCIRIARSNHSFHAFLNGPMIMESKSEKEFVSKTFPILAMIVGNLCKEPKGGSESVLIYKKFGSYAGMLNDFIQELKKNLENTETTVLELKPDEMSENTPAEVKIAGNSDIYYGLNSYKKDLGIFSDTVSSAKSLSGVLLRTKFPKSMWGGKEVQGVLTGVKTGMEKLSGKMEDFEASLERSDEDIRKEEFAQERVKWLR